MNRVRAFERGVQKRRVEEVVPTAHGRALLTPSLPRVFHLNHLSVDIGTEASADELIEECESIFAARQLRHRMVTVDDDCGARLEDGFRAAGWRIERLLVMTFAGPAPEIDTAGVEEVQPAEMEPIWEAGIRSDPEITDDEEVRQLIAGHHGRRRAVKVRYFAARLDGKIASYCELFSDGETGQIESVMTLEPFRGRGLATAVVSRALEESLARHSLTFLVADADDWPKELYRKLGFQSVGMMWDFLLRP